MLALLHPPLTHAQLRAGIQTHRKGSFPLPRALVQPHAGFHQEIELLGRPGPARSFHGPKNANTAARGRKTVAWSMDGCNGLEISRRPTYGLLLFRKSVTSQSSLKKSSRF